MQKINYPKIPHQPNESAWLFRVLAVGFWVTMTAFALLFLTLGAGIYAGLFWRAFRWTLAR